MLPTDLPRILIAALRGGSGKTVLSVGIIAALAKQGKTISPFKKGPDYIDAGWLALAAGRPCYNLDNFLIPEIKIIDSFLRHSQDCDIAVIEGNRGLYDGIDTIGKTSTAELAKLLHTPVILCLDCTKSTRTMAAIVLGCLKFDPDVPLKGVILNHVAGDRHQENIRKNIEYHCGISVLGAVPKLKKQNFPERHMGLIPTPEHDSGFDSISAIADTVAKHVDLHAIEQVAREAGFLNIRDDFSMQNSRPEPLHLTMESPKIGILKDSAFQFYYPDNIEALQDAGASVTFISPFMDDGFPDVDALYIGGGFPETHAEKLAEKESFRKNLKAMAERGLPIYAECGGLIYLGQKLILKDKSYPMAGVLPLVFGLCKKPQGHGYTLVKVEGKNPFFKVGTEFRGHEFHYSNVIECPNGKSDMVFTMQRGSGIKDHKDGFVYKNVLATYTHIHALGIPGWAESIVQSAREYKKTKKTPNKN
ncbi:MAG: cobyrinate a,c-diamide synthase [Desulfobacterales bacterium]